MNKNVNNLLYISILCAMVSKFAVADEMVTANQASENNKAYEAIRNSIEIDNLIIDGNPLFNEEQLYNLIENHTNNKLTIKDLNEISEKLTSLYHKNGFTFSKAFLPKQKVEDGSVTISIIEPLVGNIIIENEAPDKPINENMVREVFTTHVKPGKIINIKDVEKAIILLNDRAGIKVTSDIKKGEVSNTYDIILKVKHLKKYLAVAAGNNFGSSETGILNGGTSLLINDITKIGDAASLDLNISKKGMLFGKATYMRPINNYGTKLITSASHIRYKLPQEYFDILKPEGTATTASVGLSHPLVSEFNKYLNTNTGYDFKKLKNVTLAGTLNDKYIHLARTNINGKYDNNFHLGGISTLNLSYALGYLKFHDESDKEQDRLSAKSAGSFNKFNYTFEQLQRVGNKVAVFFQARGQQTLNNLDSVEKISLSGPDGVRAFKTKHGLVDQGLLLKSELLHSAYNNENIDIVSGPFLDYAILRRHHKTWTGWEGEDINIYNKYTLGGFGYKVNLNVMKSFNLELQGARPIRKMTRHFDYTKNKNQFWIQSRFSF